SRLEELAARTPTSRERYVDFLRAFSILVVVFGHWFIALIWWSDGRVGVHNVIGVTRGLWLATWVFQVIPLFFFVGGFSNAKVLEGSRRRGEPFSRFFRARAERLLRPLAIFVAAWLAVQLVAHLAGLGGSRLLRGGKLPFGPLWFLVVYVGAILLAPAMLGLHRRFGLRALGGLVTLAALVDLARFGAGVGRIGWANLAFVWLIAHQLGFFYADGQLVRASIRVHLWMVVVGLVGLVVLTSMGVYPKSMIGTDVERLSNMNPPTLPIVALTFWQVGLAMLLRERVAAWLARPGPWMGVIAANSMIMTLYLWHMTAFTMAILLLYPLGLGRPTSGTASWWVQRPIWILVPGLILAALVKVFGRFERPPSAVAMPGIPPGSPAS
ncbi:MAG: acyltransferase family protein, partial [Acidimicrobiales bacterium]